MLETNHVGFTAVIWFATDQNWQLEILTSEDSLWLQKWSVKWKKSVVFT